MPDRSSMAVAVVALAALFAGSADGQGLSDEERQLVTLIDARQAQAMALLEKAVEVNSGTMPLVPNRRLPSLYDQASRDLGFGAVSAVDPAAAGAADISFTAGRVALA